MITRTLFLTLEPNWITVGNFGDNVIGALMSSLDVEYIAEDGIVSACDVQ